MRQLANLRILALTWTLTWLAGSADVLAEVSWRLDSRFRYGARVAEPMGVATLQHQASMLAEGDLSDAWSFQLGARIRGDGAYSLARHHFADLEKQDPPEALPREANLEFQSGALIFRIGSQVFTWGEAFGSFFADVVNPKDFREAGFGEIRDLSDPVEAVNVIYAHSDWSLQGVYLPFYRPNKLPYPSSDFFPLALQDQFRGMSMDFDQSANPTNKEGDFGVRARAQLGAFDFAFFGFSHIDRRPIFQVTPLSLTQVRIRTKSTRMQTYGWTMTWAGERFVVRSEVLKNINRSFNIRQNSLLNPLGEIEGEQDVVVLGLDWPWHRGWLSGWQAGVQGSYDRVSVPQSFGRRETEWSIGAQLFKDPDSGTRYKFFGAISGADGSWLLQASALNPYRRNFEVGLETWLFGGERDSQFGSLKKSSRVMWVIKGVFSG